VLGKPYSISFEPTTRCNLKCPECHTGAGVLERKSSDMPFERFAQIVDEVSPFTITALLHFQGEPLMNPLIYRMIDYATEKRMVTEMATNATLIDRDSAYKLVKSGLKKMVVTIDSPFEDRFGFYRKGGNFKKVIEGIQNVQIAKSKLSNKYPLVVLELLALKENMDQIESFIELGISLNADSLRIKSAYLISTDQAEKKVPIGTKYSRYAIDNKGIVSLKATCNRACSAPWYKLSITHDGWVVPCCFDKSATYIMGTSNHFTISQIWFSKHYNLFRSRLLKYRGQIPVCSSCPQGIFPLDFPVGR
jgi:radical SAM protein with 4Fe4S-binding SPASM domain